jgi:two-component system, LytTR family, sensor kinase
MTPDSLDPQPLQSPAPRRIPWLVIVGVWLLFGWWNAQQSLLVSISSGEVVQSWVRPYVNAVLMALFWIVITRALMWNTRRLRDRVPAPALRVGAHLATFLVVHAADVAYWVYANALLSNPTQPFLVLLFRFAAFNGLTYAVVVMVTTALDYRDAFVERTVRAAQLEAQLSLTQFQVLRAQLHPHFLFNSLNAISALMHKDVGRADRMLARLSELLRMAIDTAATPEIRLWDEVEFVKRYLETEQMRFGDRLDVHVNVPAETYDALVPTMLLQPLVENAVRHGVAPHSGRALVEIHVQRKGSRLGIVVSDTGSAGRAAARSEDAEPSGSGFQSVPGHAEAVTELCVNEGVGLRTTRERLEKLYGEAQELVLASLPGGGFETRIVLPFRLREEPS